jgi:hypothetical protein
VADTGEDAWEDVDEAVPDDATTYITGDAATAARFQKCSFTFPAGTPVPAGEIIRQVALIYRIRLNGGTPSVIAPLMRDPGSTETYLQKADAIEGTGGTWFDYVREFPTNPFTGDRWASTSEVTDLEHGLVVLEGAVDLSRILVRVETTLDIRATPDPLELELTDEAHALMTRSKLDGTIFSPTHFAVGIGGYDSNAPTTVVPVVPASPVLIHEIYRERITHIDIEASSTPWKVHYYCRVPQDVAMGGLGEVGLIATIHQSPVPGEAGQTFLYAAQHHPCQTKHGDAVHVHRLTVEFP